MSSLNRSNVLKAKGVKNKSDKTTEEFSICIKDAMRIVEDAELPDGKASLARYLAKLPKSRRLHYCRSEKKGDKGQISACIEIQRHFRGYLARCKINQLLKTISSVTAVYGGSKHVLERQRDMDEFVNIINDPCKLQQGDDDDDFEDDSLENEWKRNQFTDLFQNNRRFVDNLPKFSSARPFEKSHSKDVDNNWLECEHEGNSERAMLLAQEIQSKLDQLQNMMHSAIKNDSTLDKYQKQHQIEQLLQLVEEARHWLANPGYDPNDLGKYAMRLLVSEGRRIAQTCVDPIKKKMLTLCEEIEGDTKNLIEISRNELGNNPAAMLIAQEIQDKLQLLKNKMHAAMMNDPFMEGNVDHTEPWNEQIQQWIERAQHRLLNPGRDKNNQGEEAIRLLVAEGRRLASYFTGQARQELLDLADEIEGLVAKMMELSKKDLEARIARKKQELEDALKPEEVKPRKLLTKDEASTIIQRSWRRHIDIQVYRYYRDLINFNSRGDPMMMLRCINPNEAKLLDSAAGIHIRFRLAGQRFPPNIYYKIYTHRPVVDMCSNSPKDYTVPAAKSTKARDTNTKNRPIVKQTSKQGWYLRIDNNGWRLVSDRLINHIMSDSVSWETSQKKYHFHHDRMKRKQDVEKRKKEKKINWMKKMYNDGMLKARSDDKETVKLIEGAAAGMVATVESLGPDALEDWEVDELLDWTTSLNFDDYLTSWKDIATSADSDKTIVDRLHILTNNMDPYEMTLSTAPSRFQSTRQSHNTPVSSASNKIWVAMA